MRHTMLVAAVIVAAGLAGVGCSDSDRTLPSATALWLFEVASVHSTDGSPVVYEINVHVLRDTGAGATPPENGTVIRALTSRGQFEDGTRNRCFLTVDGTVAVTVWIPDSESFDLTLDGGGTTATFVIGQSG
jgi:hypothetical protein